MLPRRSASSSPSARSPARSPRRRSPRLEQLEPRLAFASDWQNVELPADVDADGAVTSSDALIVINRLNRAPGQQVELGEWTTGLPFYDVDGDGYASPYDALYIINALNRAAGWTPPTTRPNNPPLPPEIRQLDATAESANEILLEWQSGGAGTTSYLVSLDLDEAAPAYCVGGIPVGEEELWLPGVAADTLYHVRVCAVDAAGRASAGAEETIRTPALATLQTVAGVNAHNLELALQAGLTAIARNRDSRNYDIPFFHAVATPDAYMEFDRHFVSNVTGRSLFALALASETLGTPPDATAVASFEKILLRSLHQPINGNYNDWRAANLQVVGLPADPTKYRTLKFDFYHLFNAGAGFRGALALTMLGDPDRVLPDYNRSPRQIFETMVNNWSQYYVHDAAGNRVYDWERFRAQFNLVGGDRLTWNINTERRDNWTGVWQNWAEPWVLNSLVRYYEHTGWQPALDLAVDLRDYAFYQAFPLSASAVPISQFSHMYEVVSEMNAFARLAKVLDDNDMMLRVKARYDAIKQHISSSTGWVPEYWGRGSDTGEANNTGELIETAIQLAEWGYGEYWQDVERYARGHLLPSQLLDTSWVDSTNRSVRDQFYGTFGFPAPYGHFATKGATANGFFAMDNVAGATVALAEIRRAAVRSSPGETRVNLLFDRNDSQLEIITPYATRGLLMHLTPKVAGDLVVRIPQWTNRWLVEAVARRQQLDFAWEGDYLRIRSVAANRKVLLPLPLVESRETDMINGRNLQIVWRGDSVVAMSSMNTSEPFFAPV